MAYRINDAVLPACAIGTWGWGTGMNGSRMIFGTKVSKNVLSETYQTAVSHGLVLFDTAAVYGSGTAETLLGEFIKNNNDILISTKYTPMKNENTGKLKDSLNGSLDRLGRSYVDILWLHLPVNIETNITRMVELLKQGRVKNIGVSNCSLAEIQVAERVLQESGYHLYGVQNHYSLLYRESERYGILEWCRENTAAFFAYMVLEQGALTGAKTLPRFSRRGMAFPKSRLKKLASLNELINDMAKKYVVTPSQIVTAHAIGKGMIPIIGVTKPYQAQQLAEAAAVSLSSGELDALEKAADNTGVTVKAAWEKRMI